MLSVIIPCYNEEKRIKETIRSLADFLNKQYPDYELIVVDDGSSDGTLEAAKSLEGGGVRVFSYQHNRGKGHALKFGFEKSCGEVIAFFDSGLDFPPSQIFEFLEILKENGADLVIGSKRHPKSEVCYPWHRQLVSFGAQILVKLLFDLGVTDTQVGLKVFKRPVLEKIMSLLLVKRYAFDIELLALARHYGFRIVEAPVKLELKLSTAVSPRSLRDCLLDTLAVFYRLKILKFYDFPKEKRERFLAEYPVTAFDRFLVFIFGDVLNRSK